MHIIPQIIPLIRFKSILNIIPSKSHTNSNPIYFNLHHNFLFSISTLIFLFHISFSFSFSVFLPLLPWDSSRFSEPHQAVALPRSLPKSPPPWPPPPPVSTRRSHATGASLASDHKNRIASTPRSQNRHLPIQNQPPPLASWDSGRFLCRAREEKKIRFSCWKINHKIPVSLFYQVDHPFDLEIEIRDLFQTPRIIPNPSV